VTPHAGARRTVVALFALVGVAVVASPAGAVATDPAAVPALTGNAPVAVDPVPPGEVAVVAASAPVRDQVAFVVENGSDATVRVVKVTAVAERSTGTQATRASTTAVAPARLAPGERAIGRVTFRRGTIDLAPTLTWEVRTARAAASPDPTRLAVGDLVLSPPKGAVVAQTLDLTLTNPQTRALSRPFVVEVLCLNEAGRPAVLARAGVGRTKLGAGKSTPVTAELRELCPSFVVGARATLAR
jgi:hypothetical protein